MSSQIGLYKIVLLGESGVGKTSIISQFVDQEFQEDLQISTGSTYSSKTLLAGNDKLLKFEIWDTAGQERYRSLTKLFYKDSNAAILVYDITREDSFEQLQEYWVTQIKESAPKNIIIAICGNKSDLINNEKVDEGKAREYAKEVGAIFGLTSAKSSFGINDLFIQIAKKLTGEENITIKNDDEGGMDIEEQKNENSKRKGTVMLNKENKNENNGNNKNAKQKKCC